VGRRQVWWYREGRFTEESLHWPDDHTGHWLEGAIRAGYDSGPWSLGDPAASFALEVYEPAQGREEDVPAPFLVNVLMAGRCDDVLLPSWPDLLQFLALVTPIGAGTPHGREVSLGR